MDEKIDISGMHCGKCVKRIENALSQIKGIEAVKVSLENNKDGQISKSGYNLQAFPAKKTG